jgi:hypothetical protein
MSPDDVAAHEQDVSALLAGETPEGSQERAAIESDAGPITAVELAGTMVDGDELRTYVTVRTAEGSLLAWYHLDEEGGVGATELGTDPPSLALGSSGGGAYRPDDPLGTGPDVTVAFDGDRMTISGPAGTTGTTTARLAR